MPVSFRKFNVRYVDLVAPCRADSERDDEGLEWRRKKKNVLREKIIGKGFFVGVAGDTARNDLQNVMFMCVIQYFI